MCPTRLFLLFLSLVLLAPACEAADTFWAQFPNGAFPVGPPVTLPLAPGSHVDVTVMTGGTQGAIGTDLDTLGRVATGLDYDRFPVLAIFNGGGTSTVPTSLTFSGAVVGAGHRRGLFMVGAVNGLSSPVTLSTMVPGLVATWTMVGEPFAYSGDNSYDIQWDAATGQITTSATGGIDSKCIVIDLGDLRDAGTVTVTLEQALGDGIRFGFGEQLTAPLDVDPTALAGGLRLSAPRPNPARDAVTLEFVLPEGGPVRLAVYDLAGRRLATLAAGSFEAGAHTATWDLRDDAGSRLPAGLVFARLDGPRGVCTRRLLVTH